MFGGDYQKAQEFDEHVYQTTEVAADQRAFDLLRYAWNYKLDDPVPRTTS